MVHFANEEVLLALNAKNFYTYEYYKILLIFPHSSALHISGCTAVCSPIHGQSFIITMCFFAQGDRLK